MITPKTIPASPELLRTCARLYGVDIHIEMSAGEIAWVKVKNGVWTPPMTGEEAWEYLDQISRGLHKAAQ